MRALTIRSLLLVVALVVLVAALPASASELESHDRIALSVTLGGGPILAGLDNPRRPAGGLNDLPVEFHDDFVFGVAMAITSWVFAGIGTAMLIHSAVESSHMDPDQPTMGGALIGVYSLVPYGLSLGFAIPSWIAAGVVEPNRGAQATALRAQLPRVMPQVGGVCVRF
jgi:hypothetical protein